MKRTFIIFTPLLVVFTVLLSSHFIDAAWIAPSGQPSADNNAPAPINVSADNQLKLGDITALNLKAGSQMWSAEYCDENGENCTGAMSGSGPFLPSGMWCGLKLSAHGSPQFDCDGHDPQLSCPSGYTSHMFARMGSLGGNWYTCYKNDSSGSGGGSNEAAQCYGQGGSDFSSVGYFQAVCTGTANNACGMVDSCSRGEAVVYGGNRCKWTCSYDSAP